MAAAPSSPTPVCPSAPAIAAKDYKDNGNTDGLSSLAGSFSGMAAGFYHGDWAALVTALSTNSKNDILSTPSIVTMDNKEASFNVGQEVPVQSGSQSSTTSDQVFNTIERKTVGTKLVVTPQINEGDSVLLNIEQEVSSVAQKQATGTANLGPTFDTRTVKNAVLVKSGETVVLGGLMDEQTQEQISKVPLLRGHSGAGLPVPFLQDLHRQAQPDGLHPPDHIA
jgi:general secretion pathway protein D